MGDFEKDSLDRIKVAREFANYPSNGSSLTHEFEAERAEVETALSYRGMQTNHAFSEAIKAFVDEEVTTVGQSTGLDAEKTLACYDGYRAVYSRLADEWRSDEINTASKNESSADEVDVMHKEIALIYRFGRREGYKYEENKRLIRSYFTAALKDASEPEKASLEEGRHTLEQQIEAAKEPKCVCGSLSRVSPCKMPLLRALTAAFETNVLTSTGLNHCAIQGEIRDRTAEGQHYRMTGLTLLAAIIIFWNTKHLGHAAAARSRHQKTRRYRLFTRAPDAHLTPRMGAYPPHGRVQG